MSTERITADRVQRGDVFFSRRGVRHTVKLVNHQEDGTYQIACRCGRMRWAPNAAGDYLRIERRTTPT